MGVVRSSKETVSFGKSFGGELGGALESVRSSKDTTNFGGSFGGAATFGGKDGGEVAHEASRPGASKPGASKPGASKPGAS